MVRPLAGLVLVAGWLLAGCGAQAAAPPPASPTPAAKTGLAALAPCDLLSSVDRSSAGLTSLGEDKTIGTARACDWTESGMFGLTVTLDDTAAVDDLKVDGGTPLMVGRHQATKVPGDGACAVLLPAGAKASVQVDVTNASFRDTNLACRRATTVAQLVEPKLP
ncbi:DUF3558 domain-containing protein [Amycolatopsis acidiphila]|uniref:DUF3558 domain-containing protein n=1 Tax=Amycolatopsis acidiphila TaxID=715473 RepID=A0A557ZY79_9PSEU|nr:DUF3558 family protein [Amycolatopsis acidiphila]TVT16975.1 DUF3558 domain-containing protein [Amycolatopsis acidiphila]UIJ62143.1 DUF3558 domain-containing protein [Amycolatopsis acidiphila]